MQKIADTLKYYFDRRFSTVAGTLVYFLLMSIAPFMLWLTLVFGKVDISRFLDSRFLQAAGPILKYLKGSAENAAGGAGIVLIATSLYSSTSFFYHLKRSGEIIYESPQVKGGTKIRIASLGLIAAAIVLIFVTAGISVAGSTLMNTILPFYISETISYSFMTVLMFFAALVLNIFACPYKLKPREAAAGSLLTTALWLISTTGFNIYTTFANPERLYGRIASLIIFLLWCYIMMCCFVVGMINNGRHVARTHAYGNALYGNEAQKNKEPSLRKTL